MGETIKAHQRRVVEGWYGRWCSPLGIDIGCEREPILSTYRRWDYIYGDGDATHMQGIPDGAYPTVYCSHALEHLSDPATALRNWYRILAPGGHLIVCVPHRNLYEKRTELPSRWNPDHKLFFLPDADEPPHTLGFRPLLLAALPRAALVSFRTLDAGYEANGEGHAQGEYSIEAILHRPFG